MKFSCTLISILAIFFLHACANGKKDQVELVYPPSDEVKAYFSTTSTPEGCRVFAQVLAGVPAMTSGAAMRDALFKEAMSKGANAVLIGQSRENLEEIDAQSFSYHGPEQEFPCGRSGCWRFGDKEWSEQGSYIGMGYEEWGNPEMKYDFPMCYKAMFLRCP